jgi:hypothetical protein
MQNRPGHAGMDLDMHHRHGHVSRTRTYIMDLDMHRIHAMQHGHGQEHAEWTCTYMDLQNQHGY